MKTHHPRARLRHCLLHKAAKFCLAERELGKWVWLKRSIEEITGKDGKREGESREVLEKGWKLFIADFIGWSDR